MLTKTLWGPVKRQILDPPLSVSGRKQNRIACLFDSALQILKSRCELTHSLRKLFAPSLSFTLCVPLSLYLS